MFTPNCRRCPLAQKTSFVLNVPKSRMLCPLGQPSYIFLLNLVMCITREGILVVSHFSGYFVKNFYSGTILYKT
ncbi:hypothetical protein Hanom_Chr01g00072111 [Helianthus anomalus]